MVKLKDLLSSKKDSELRTLYEKVLTNSEVELTPIRTTQDFILEYPLTDQTYKNRAAHLATAVLNSIDITIWFFNNKTIEDVKHNFLHYNEDQEHIVKKLETIEEHKWIADLFEETYNGLERILKEGNKYTNNKHLEVVRVSNNLVWTEAFYKTGFFPKDLEAMRGQTQTFLEEELDKLMVYTADLMEDEVVTLIEQTIIDEDELILPNYTLIGSSLVIIKTGEGKPTQASINKELELAAILSKYNKDITHVEILFVRYGTKNVYEVNRKQVLTEVL